MCLRKCKQQQQRRQQKTSSMMTMIIFVEQNFTLLFCSLGERKKQLDFCLEKSEKIGVVLMMKIIGNNKGIDKQQHLLACLAQSQTTKRNATKKSLLALCCSSHQIGLAPLNKLEQLRRVENVSRGLKNFSPSGQF